MCLSVVLPALEFEIVDVGRAAVAPSSSTVNFASFGRLVAVRSRAVTVAGHESRPLRPAHGADGPTDIEHVAVAGHDDPRDLAVAHDAVERCPGQRTAVATLGPQRLDELGRAAGQIVHVDDDGDVRPHLAGVPEIPRIERPAHDVGRGVGSPLRRGPGVVRDPVAFHLGIDRGFPVLGVEPTELGVDLQQSVEGSGPLDSPWGLAIAPAGFAGIDAPDPGAVLLVGNFGNGQINVFDAATGNRLGRLEDPDGEPIEIDGLRALKVGNGGAGGLTDTVYFTAGSFDESHGLFGSLATVAPGTPEGPAEAQLVQAHVDVVQLDQAQLDHDIASGAPAAVIKQDTQTLKADSHALAHVQHEFDKDTAEDALP
jgi:hypothetical protein